MVTIFVLFILAVQSVIQAESSLESTGEVIADCLADTIEDMKSLLKDLEEEHDWLLTDSNRQKLSRNIATQMKIDAFLDGGLSGTTISNILGDSLTEFEAVLKEIKKEQALLLEEIENANIVITKIIGANCYPFLLDMAVVLAGWMIPIIVPPLYLTSDFIEYLKCVLEHKDKSDCTYLLDTADNYLKGLPIVFKEFLEDYLQVIEDVPTTFCDWITPMN